VATAAAATATRAEPSRPLFRAGSGSPGPEPENALTKQYAALVEADGASLSFTEDGIAEIARIAAHVNDRMENIGARRLHTVMTTLLEEVLYDLPDKGISEVTVDRALVTDRLKAIVEDEDLRRYIL
jgi:ATP-dependent HslUV protease ATP-binding subunit HslU